MSDEDLWHLVAMLAGLSDDARVDIRMPNGSMVCSAGELRPLIDDAWAVRGRDPDPDWLVQP